jgi:hypothetical protein
MNIRIISISLIMLFLLSGNAYSQNKQQQKSVYEQAGTIKLKDPKAVMVGYRQPSDDIFEISLDDVGKYTGHVCAGISSAYILTQQALALLYPNGEIPVRGQISIAASANTDHLEVASYIVRARQNDPENKGKNIAIVDTNIITAPKTVTLIFKRADNGKMVKAIFNKDKLLTPKLKKKMMPLKKKVVNGTASDKEKMEFAKTVQEVVALIITNTPEGVITVSECTDYKFPEK